MIKVPVVYIILYVSLHIFYTVNVKDFGNYDEHECKITLVSLKFQYVSVYKMLIYDHFTQPQQWLKV